MANAWKREKPLPFLYSRNLLLFLPLALLVFLFYFSRSPNPIPNLINKELTLNSPFPYRSIKPFDCFKCPQGYPVIANVVEGVRYPFLYSLADLGSLPDKPHKNIVRMLKGKPFRKPDISVTIQEVLGKLRPQGGVEDGGYVVDVGANVGIATFAAAAMGFKVLAFEPVFENLQRICDGIFLNRVADRVTLFEAAVSDRLGNITFHKCYRIMACGAIEELDFPSSFPQIKTVATVRALVGRLDNSAVSATGAKLAFKSNEEIELQVRSIPLDEVIPESEEVSLLKIDVQGWEYHVLRGASKLLSRKKGRAPYIIYEEDERLLQASNSSAKEIREFLGSMGYHHCTQHGTDAHCTQ